jgi:flagellar motility protein MotE (MotC chaperone)
VKKLPRFEFRFQLLPVVGGAAALLLALKVANVVAAVGGPVEAHAEARPQIASAAAPASEEGGEAKSGHGAETKDKGKDDKGKDKAKSKEKPEPKPEAVEAKPPAAPRTAPQASMSATELDVLQSLGERRAELDRRNDELQQREVLLKATEQRINDKIAQLQAIEKSISETVKKHDDENDAKIKNLVKIYETMKPKEAARIFEQLDMPVLIEVAGHMKEMKLAPVLASMDAGKAKSLTLALADRKPAEAPAAK